MKLMPTGRLHLPCRILTSIYVYAQKDELCKANLKLHFSIVLKRNQGRGGHLVFAKVPWLSLFLREYEFHVLVKYESYWVSI